MPARSYHRTNRRRYATPGPLREQSVISHGRDFAHRPGGWFEPRARRRHAWRILITRPLEFSANSLTAINIFMLVFGAVIVPCDLNAAMTGRSRFAHKSPQSHFLTTAANSKCGQVAAILRLERSRIPSSQPRSRDSGKAPRILFS